MSTSALENEDLENVPLVRMEDVQPSRTYDLISRRRSDEEVLETCVIENIEYDNECIVDDDEDSNIGSMVSIQSEEVVDEDSEPEMIVPEMIDDTSTANSVLEPITRYQGLCVQEEDERKPPSSWPTLEILPGGVIKKPEKWNDRSEQQTMCDNDEPKVEEMMYACAKCPQRFKYLFCLVKHVKWHEDEDKKLIGARTETKKKQNSREFVCSHTKKRKIVIHAKPHKKKTPKKLKS